MKSLQCTSNQILVEREDGSVSLISASDLNITSYSREVDGLIRCTFSSDDDKNIIILTENKLEVVVTPLSKTVYKRLADIQQHMTFADMQINTLSKEVILLSNNQML